MNTMKTRPTTSTDADYEITNEPLIIAEHERLRNRQNALGCKEDATTCEAWGLALSGGGIRSATFCLGVLQALSRIAPHSSEKSQCPTGSILARFDYLSTVSGGGYIGAFFMSLFIPGRLRPVANHTQCPKSVASTAQALETATYAYEAMTYDPPGRIKVPQANNNEKPSPAQTALAWLRDNGRYLTPTGAGDGLYAAVSAVRAWLGMQYFLGILLFTIMCGLGLVKLGLISGALLIRPELSGHIQALSPIQCWVFTCSELWYLPPAFLCLGFLPCSASFWLTYPFSEELKEGPSALMPWYGAIVAFLGCMCLITNPQVYESHVLPLPPVTLYGLTVAASLPYIWLIATGIRFKRTGDNSSDVVHHPRIWKALCCLILGAILLGLTILASDTKWGTMRLFRKLDGSDLIVFLTLGFLPVLFACIKWIEEPFHLDHVTVAFSLMGVLLWLSIRYIDLFYGFPNYLRWVIVISLLIVTAALQIRRFWGDLVVCDTNVHRVRMTRALVFNLICVILLVFAATTDTLALTVYQHRWTPSVSMVNGSAIALLVLLIRQMPRRIDLAGTRKFRIPLNVLAAVLGLFLAISLCTFWDFLVLLTKRNLLHIEDNPPSQWSYEQFFWLFLLAAWLTRIASQDWRFLNLSTLSSFYSARLTRSYLGASNSERFSNTSKKENFSSAEAVPSDEISVPRYAENTLAPQHLINICLNHNVDPAEQLVQRDRKGRSFVVMPQNGGKISIDGSIVFKPTDKAKLLSIGEWIAISGAAVSTGLGRYSTLGYSFLLGLANIRLGRWWKPGAIKPNTQEQNNNLVITTKDRNLITRIARAAFPAHVYMVEELFGRFYGLRRPLLHLTDGGHFDNTGLYELLRPERKLSRILMCDCGADPDYAFNDLANLIRLVRIDFGLELIVDNKLASSAATKAVFGKMADFGEKKEAGRDCCALLLKGYYRENVSRTSANVTVIVIKLAMVRGLPVDITNYNVQNQTFPHESTADQFFGESQWESYRKLGVELAYRVFCGRKSDRDHAETLWKQWQGDARV